MMSSLHTLGFLRWHINLIMAYINAYSYAGGIAWVVQPKAEQKLASPGTRTVTSLFSMSCHVMVG